jgi:ubiquinone/menaquinone biosynthesis C-methylase UbiE/uncharacterized protein YbaR (Trm112 family)
MVATRVDTRGTVADLLPDDFVARLRCPLSGAPLFLVRAGQAGSAFSDRFDAALTTPDGNIVYPIRAGIVCLLPDTAIVRDGRALPDDGRADDIKHEVQQFYDQLGWKKEEEVFSDAAIFEDLREVARQYRHDCHMRVAKYLPSSGDYLLDVASGPVQYDEYLKYSEQYRYRVCVDLSFLALVEARRRLGDKGIYVLGDVTNLPFSDDSFDGVVSLHTIYHVPALQQEKSFNEIYRVLAPGGDAVVVYSWGRHSMLMLATVLPILAWRHLRRRFRHLRPGSRKELYAHQHGYRWFANRRWPFSHKLRSWRSVGVDFTKLYIHDWLFGRRILAAIFRLEDRWPRLFGIIGQYPMVVIEKPAKLGS